MSWFSAAQFSSFAKQALSQAQKSIDRVLDIKEDELSWIDGNVITPSFNDAVSVSPSFVGGWGTPKWETISESSPEETLSSPKAITRPVTRTVVDESENFFSAFLTTADVTNIEKSPVVSKPPAKSQRPKEDVKDSVPEYPDFHASESIHANQANSLVIVDLDVLNKNDALDGSTQTSAYESLESQKEENFNDKCEKLHGDIDQKETAAGSETQTVITDNCEKDAIVEVAISHEHLEGPSVCLSKSPSHLGKEVASDKKEQKNEDRQSNTPSPPVSSFSSGTSTTSDIEVLDHESVISESSVSSRQETTDAKENLNLMQNSFQLLSASACADYHQLDDYQKLAESCSSSDAFERIDSFSVQSVDSRSVSELNSDDDSPGRSCTLASVTLGSSVSNAETGVLTECKADRQQMNETEKGHSLEETEMDESGRSATPVNCEQTEDLVVSEQLVATERNDLQVLPDQTPLPAAEGPPNWNSEKQELQKITDDLSERLEKREIQLLAVSKEKARLEEKCDNLSDEIIRLKEENSGGISSLRGEFTQRIAEAERKAHVACKERDTIKKELMVMKEELATRLNSNETAEVMREKDEQIAGLMLEGEKLSKQQLQNSNIIKKLRTKEKENETLIIRQAKKIKELEEEQQHLQQVLDGKEEVERQHRENIKKLSAVIERQEKDLGKLQIDMDELYEKNRSLQSALDNAYKELAELHKANVTKDSEAQEAALSREMKAKEELCFALEKVQQEAQQKHDALITQVTDLRLTLQRAEQQQARKEDYLRQEISELQLRLQEAENRNQELSQSVTSATRPLLRQIENLQATLGAQTSSWEKLEKNLTARLADAQAQLAAYMERERAATEELLSLKTQSSAVDSQNTILRQEKSRLQAQLEAERCKQEKLEDERNRYHADLDNLKSDYTRTLEETKKEKTLLLSQLEMEKMKVEQEKKKAFLAQEALREKERKAYTNSALDAGTGTPALSRSSSVSGLEMASFQSAMFSQIQDDLHENSFGSMAVSTSGSTLYDAVRMGAAPSIVENLQSQVKLKEGEIAQLQLEITSLERTRAIMAEELVKLTNQNDELESKVKEIPGLRRQLRDLDQKLNTILQMYGEKAEEAEELRLDLEDVKNMYKSQIDELLKQRIS